MVSTTSPFTLAVGSCDSPQIRSGLNRLVDIGGAGALRKQEFSVRSWWPEMPAARKLCVPLEREHLFVGSLVALLDCYRSRSQYAPTVDTLRRLLMVSTQGTPPSMIARLRGDACLRDERTLSGKSTTVVCSFEKLFSATSSVGPLGTPYRLPQGLHLRGEVPSFPSPSYPYYATFCLAPSCPLLLCALDLERCHHHPWL